VINAINAINAKNVINAISHAMRQFDTYHSCDIGDVDDVTRPVSVRTINTTDGNAASRDSEMVGWGGDRRATGAADALDSGEGRGIAGVTTTTPMGGPGDDDVEAVGRFRRAGRR
jgi:hypothetical protein